MKEGLTIDGMLTGVPVFEAIKLVGKTVNATTAGTTNPIKVLLYDEGGYILYSTGLEVPTDATAGYAKGALHVDTNIAAGTSGLYVNVGTTSAANFDLVTDA